ncbi:uncharacterized protein BDV14DRAFT_3460 [Aspergillus stella-maris]|uniref:uncharacterized protein n=1 Tax=Aspergillus stella-maris TaxID=1810926 RepID=UPI003CCDF7DA
MKMSSTLRPQYFCSRPNGALVPLIAVDELPSSIFIHGAPPALSAAETQGMTSLGCLGPRGQIYLVESSAPAASRSSSNGGTSQQPRSSDLQAELVNLFNNNNLSADERSKLQALIQHMASTWQMNNPSTAGALVPRNGGSYGNGVAQQVRTNSRNFKKEFCSYWIRHGECDYSQQGCLYKHEMPLDKEGLDKVGLRDIPKWYREKTGHSSLLPNGHAHPRPNTSSLKNDTTQKPIQYPAQLAANEAGQRSAGTSKPLDQRTVVYRPAPQASGFAGSSQMAFNSMIPPMTPFPQPQPQAIVPRQISTGNRKADFISFDHSTQDYMSSSNMLFSPPNGTNLDAPRKTPHEDLVHSLHSLTMSPGLPSADHLSSPFDPAVDPSRFNNVQRSRRLYEGIQDAISSAAELAEANPLHAYHNQTAASSNSASPASKATGSQLTSPGLDITRGSTTSVSPPHDASPTSQAPAVGPVPNTYLRRGNQNGSRRAFDAFSGRMSRSQRSGESSEDDLKK